MPRLRPKEKTMYLMPKNKKYEIASYKGDNLLNERTETLTTCRHRNKCKLKNCDSMNLTDIMN